VTRTLLASGGVVFAILGIGHAVLTLRDLSKPRTFTPPDETLRESMQASTVAIHPTANLWRAWMGFNLSHALGVVVFGSTITVIALTNAAMYERSTALKIAAPLIGSIYVLLARFFWFRDPVVGTSIGTALLLAASAFAYAG
jgi:hypothetical protein